MPKRLLAPPFITKLDDFLLRNRPDTWSTRFHLVLWYWLLYTVALTVIYFVIPDNPLERSNIGYWIAGQVILVIVGVVLWMIYLFRFNLFKSYGDLKPGDRIKTFSIYLVTLMLLIGTVFVPPLIESYKTYVRFSPDQMIDDINEMNVLLGRINKEYINSKIEADTIIIVDNNGFVPPTTSDYLWDDSLGAYKRAPIYMSRDDMKWMIAETDSIVWVSNDRLLRYTPPALQFVSSYRISDRYEKELYTNFEVYNRIFGDQQPEEKSQLIRRYHTIADKYMAKDDDFYSYYSLDTLAGVMSNYSVGEVNSGIGNIASRYFRWEAEDVMIGFRVCYYIGMFLAMAVFIFRHSTVKTFFLSILSSILITIITGIILALGRSNEDGILITAIVYFFIFLIVALAMSKYPTRTAVSGIALNLTVLMTPFIPILFTLLYYHYNRYSYYDYAYSPYNGFDYQIPDRSWEFLHYIIAEILGLVIMLILSETGYKWLFRRWYSAPEE
ncbi:MAG: hypothetical protein RL007_2090 [Bacteroidota bacterium]|jgi:hypothetical protein